MPVPLLLRRQTHFVFWRPGPKDRPPRLVLGTFQPGTPPTLQGERIIPLGPSPDSDEVWEIAARDCQLEENQVYHYWFEVVDTAPFRTDHPTLRCTDPTAYSVDWRLRANSGDEQAAASVIRYSDGRLFPTDTEKHVPPFKANRPDTGDVPMASLPPNNRLVIYELPTAWTKSGDLVDAQDVGVGTFRDVRALIEAGPQGGHFDHVRRVGAHRHLLELGVNALELLPPADTFADR